MNIKTRKVLRNLVLITILGVILFIGVKVGRSWDSISFHFEEYKYKYITCIAVIAGMGIPLSLILVIGKKLVRKYVNLICPILASAILVVFIISSMIRIEGMQIGEKLICLMAISASIATIIMSIILMLFLEILNKE